MYTGSHTGRCHQSGVRMVVDGASSEEPTLADHVGIPLHSSRDVACVFFALAPLSEAAALGIHI